MQDREHFITCKLGLKHAANCVQERTKSLVKFTLMCRPTLSKSSSFMFIWHYSSFNPPPPRNNRQPKPVNRNATKTTKLLQSEWKHVPLEQILKIHELWQTHGLRCDLYVTGHLNTKTEQLDSVYNPRFPESSRYGRVHERAGESNSAWPRDHVHTWPADLIKP